MDIVSLPVEIKEEKLINRFRLVNLASQRTKELMEGIAPVINTKYTKETTVALQEIVSTDFTLLTGKEAREAMMEASLKEMETAEASAGVEDSEESDEIKKDLSVYLNDADVAKRDEGE